MYLTSLGACWNERAVRTRARSGGHACRVLRLSEAGHAEVSMFSAPVTDSPA